MSDQDEPEIDEISDHLVAIPEAAEFLGMHASQLRLLTGNHSIPSQRVGRKVFIEKTIVDEIKDLRKAHGRNWLKFAGWIDRDGETSKTKTKRKKGGGRKRIEPEVETQDDSVEVSEAPPSLTQKIIEFSNELYQKGSSSDREVAFKLLTVVLNHYDWSEK